MWISPNPISKLEYCYRRQKPRVSLMGTSWRENLEVHVIIRSFVSLAGSKGIGVLPAISALQHILLNYPKHLWWCLSNCNIKIPSLLLSPWRQLDLEWALDIGIGIAAYTMASSPKAGWFPKFQKYLFSAHCPFYVYCSSMWEAGQMCKINFVFLVFLPLLIATICIPYGVNIFESELGVKTTGKHSQTLKVIGSLLFLHILVPV